MINPTPITPISTAILWCAPCKETITRGRPSTRRYIFPLPFEELLGLDEVYIFGKFNNYALTDGNRMTYNENNGLMEGTLLLKQGFYNYKYVIKREDAVVELNTICGNFHFTENSYLILVYYRKFGDLYDSLIGVGSANSRNISN